MFSSLALRAATITALAVALSGAVASGALAAPAGPGPGNAPNAKQCQKGGWENLATSSGTAFASEAGCVSYAAGGGVLSPKSAATLLVDLGTCTFQTVTEFGTFLDCPTISITGAGLMPGAELLACYVIFPGPDSCETGIYVEADGTLPDSVSGDGGCYEGDVITLSTMTASGTPIQAIVTCTRSTE